MTSSAATSGTALGHLRRLAPQILCVAVVPALLSMVTMRTVGLAGTAVSMLVWTTAASIWHRWRHGVVPGLFVIRFAGDLLKVAVTMVTGSATVYFLQPSASTLVIALTCGASVLVGRPLGARVAKDFLPASALEGRVDGELFNRITLWWAASKAVSALGGAFVFTHVPLETFLIVRPFVGWTCSAVGAAGVAWIWTRANPSATPAPVLPLPLPMPVGAPLAIAA